MHGQQNVKILHVSDSYSVHHQEFVVVVCVWWLLGYRAICLTFRRLMSTIVDVPHRKPPKVAFYIFIQQI